MRADFLTGVAEEGMIEFIPGSARLKQNEENDYLIDRELQKNESFSGISSIRAQDSAIADVQGGGAIPDRSKEFLVASDKAIVALRARILKGITQFDKTGRVEEAFALGQTEFRGIDIDVQNLRDFVDTPEETMVKQVK